MQRLCGVVIHRNAIEEMDGMLLASLTAGGQLCKCRCSEEVAIQFAVARCICNLALDIAMVVTGHLQGFLCALFVLLLFAI